MRRLVPLLVLGSIAAAIAGLLLVAPGAPRAAARPPVPDPGASGSPPSDTAHRPQVDLGFDVRPLAPGVYAVIRRNPPGFLFDCNSGFIVGSKGVAVVDAQFTTESARQVITALKKITREKVLYVINTHAHDDHVSGNQAYREAYPEVKFVAHIATERDLNTGYLERRKQLAANLPEALASLRGALAADRGSDGAPLDSDQVVRLQNDIALGERYVTEAPAFRLQAPNRTFRDSLTLSLGDRNITLRFLGRAHTAGDIVVQLRNPDIVFCGDLVVWPVPLAGTTSYPLEYAATLQRLRALPHATMVPGHGPVMTGDDYLDLMVRLMTAIRTQTEAAVARGDSLGALMKNLDLEEFRRAFCGNGKVKNQLFQGYVVQPGVARAYAQATAAKH